MINSRRTSSITAYSFVAWVMFLLVVLAARASHITTQHTARASGHEAAAVNYIYWTDSGSDQILRAKPGGTPEVLLNNQPDPRGISLDLSAGRMYWADRELRQILRANLDGSNRQVILNSGDGLGRPNMLALALGAGKMYWTDNQLDTINRANLNGSQHEVLLDRGKGVDGPIGIALDLVNGKMYWVEFANRRIRRANLNGSAVENLVTSGLSQPLEIALDVSGGKMYWTDDGQGVIAIRRANLNGTNVENLVTAANGLSNPRGLALDLVAGKMYWLDWGAKRMQTANLNGSGINTLFTASDGLSNPLSLALDLTSSPTCYSLTTNHSGAGSDPAASPSSSPGCPNGRYIAGASLSLTASPAIGWRVQSWSGTNNNSSTAESNTATMPAANHTVSVQYVEIEPDPECYQLTLTHTGAGADPTTNPPNSSGCGNGRYEAGTVIALTAAPAAGWQIAGWSGTNNNNSTSSTNSVTMPSTNHSVVVHYVAIPGTATPTLTPTLQPTASPTATSTPPTPATPAFAEGLYLPMTIFVPCHHLVLHEPEPNDSPEEAFGPLCFNRQYTGYPNNRDDYYFFQVDTTAAIAIELTGITGRAPQLQLYREKVLAANLVQSVGPGPYVINRILTPGRYYLRVFVSGDYNSTTLYTLRIQR